MRVLSFCFLAGTAFQLPAPVAALPFFSGIGDVPGGDFASRAYAVSGDGTVVVGSGHADLTGFYSELVPARWTQATGTQLLFTPATSEIFAFAWDVSEDGQLVVGGQAPDQAWLWSESSGPVYSVFPNPSVSYFETTARAISADGNYAAGSYATTTTSLAIRWDTSGAGYDLLGDLPGGAVRSNSFDISGDGGVVVGNSNATCASGSGSCDRAFRWTEATGMVALSGLPTGNSDAYAVSRDGGTIVGAAAAQAFVWDAVGGVTLLGHLPGGVFSSEAFGVSADGSVVVGRSSAGPGSYPLAYAAFVWDAVNGMRRLDDLIQNEYGIDLTGWTLFEATDISDDGLTIVGNGINPDGNVEGWVFRFGTPVPEPGAGLLVTLGLGALGAAQRRHCAGRSTTGTRACARAHIDGSHGAGPARS